MRQKDSFLYEQKKRAVNQKKNKRADGTAKGSFS